MAQAHILHMAQPVVGQANARAARGRQHAATAIVPHHHDVFHLERINGILNDRQGIQVGVHHHIGHIAMDKHFARLKTGNLIGGHTAVGATDPQIFGRLLLRQMIEETRLLKLHALSPCTVVVKEVREVFGSHACMFSALEKWHTGFREFQQTIHGQSACA